jgi:hypothetical protein
MSKEPKAPIKNSRLIANEEINGAINIAKIEPISNNIIAIVL